MFPERPRRPMPPSSPFTIGRPNHHNQAPAQSNLLAQFKTPDGKLDFEKISATTQQMQEIYGQVRPMINQVSPMITKFIKR